MPIINEQVESNPDYQTILDPDSDFATFEKAKIRIDRLIDNFGRQVIQASDNRDCRFKDFDIEHLRRTGKLDQHQFLIPMRTIDSNIRREHPAYMNYIKQSKRIVIFKDLLDSTIVTSRLENEFSTGVKYPGWERPHFKVVDGAATHGWDAIEVVFDESKPFNFALEHIGNDRLIIPLDAKNIQDCELIARSYNASPKQLMNFILKHGFDQIQVEQLLDKNRESKKEDTILIYKCYWKYNNQVYVAWHAKDLSDWLKAPEPHYLGRQRLLETQGINELGQVVPISDWVEEPETMFPIFVLPYYETEQDKIIDHKGRVFLDKNKQTALTANISQFLNGCQIASSLFPSLKTEPIRQSEIENIKIAEGIVPPVPIEYHSPPYPDAVMLSLQQYLEVYNSQEAGQTNFAVQNRKDSRKTATEIAAAKDQATELGSVQTTLYSIFIRDVYTFVWEIVRSQALQGKITLLPDPETGQNNVEMLQRSFEIKSAGDIDVIEREKLIQQYKDFWPVVQQTAIAVPFLARLLRLVFPDEGDKYADLLQLGDPRALITELVQLMDVLVDEQVLVGLPEPQRSTLARILEQAKVIADGYMREVQQPGEENNNGENNQPQQTSTSEEESS